MQETDPGSLLLVEDDARIRELMVAAAERCGQFTSIHAVEDGQAAVDWIWERYRDRSLDLPSIVLTDLCMPRMDGIRMVRELKRHPETMGIPVALTTSSNRPHDREDALAAGCCAFFEKPVRFHEMVALIGSLTKQCGRTARCAS